jgi:hypothetical protein
MGLRILAVVLAVGFAAQGLSAAEPVKVADPKDKQLVDGFFKHAMNMPNYLSAAKCKSTVEAGYENITWRIAPYSEIPLIAYELTGDANCLDAFVKTFANLRSAMIQGPDGHLGWYGKPDAGDQNPKAPEVKTIDMAINDFALIGQLARFVEFVKADPALAAKYAKQVEEYLDLAENQLFKTWDARGMFVDLGVTGGVYRNNPELAQVFLTEPHNKHSIIIHGLLPLYRVTGKDLYMKRAIQLGTRYKHCLGLKDGHYEWRYWDPSGAWDVGLTDKNRWQAVHYGQEHKGGYYAETVSQAVALYQHGVVFDKADMDRFVKTQETVVWNGDAASPKWARTDGTVDPKYMQGEYISLSLAPLSPKVAEYCFEKGPAKEGFLKAIGDNWSGGAVMRGWIEAKLVILPKAAGGKQIYAEAGQKFLQKKENQDWYKTLQFEVAGSGYASPATPAQMKSMPPEPAKP